MWTQIHRNSLNQEQPKRIRVPRRYVCGGFYNGKKRVLLQIRIIYASVYETVIPSPLMLRFLYSDRGQSPRHPASTLSTEREARAARWPPDADEGGRLTATAGVLGHCQAPRPLKSHALKP